VGKPSHLDAYVYPRKFQFFTLKMGTELVAETSETLHILTRMSARENFVEFCCRENFYAYIPLCVYVN